MKRTYRMAVAASAAVVAGLALAAPARANNDSLQLPGYGAIVVDQTHKHVFVSGGPSANAIAVADFDGDRDKPITGQPGATGMVLSADGTTLYAALSTGDAITAIDTKTLKETARYPTGAQTCPTRLARTGQRIWFGYGCGTAWSGGVGRLDLTVNPPAVSLNLQGDTPFQGAPLVAATGADPGPLVAAQPALSLSTVAVFTANSGELTPVVSGSVAGSNLADTAISPDGATLYTAAGSRDSVAGFSMTDLAGRGAFATGRFPNAAAVSSDGAYLIAGVFNPDKDVYVYRLSTGSLVKRIELGSGVTLADRGLALLADSKILFAVVQPIGGTSPSLRIVSRPLS
jgi:YVTN family beta-propeller protein